MIKADHSSLSPNGHIAYLVTYQKVKSTARYVSPTFPELGQQCFSFWFIKTGTSGSATIKLLHRFQQNLQKDTVWQSDQTHFKNEWIHVQNTVNFVGRSQMVFQVETLAGSNMSIALDDIAINPFECSQPVSCNFKEDACNWKNELLSNSNNLLWSLGQGRVANSSKLKSPYALYNDKNELYSDFTTTGSNGGQMEMLSEFVKSPKSEKACLTMQYNVKNIKLDSPSDQFKVSQVDINGVRKTLWSFTDKLAVNQQKIQYISVPNSAGNASYRLSLLAHSSSASTFIEVKSIKYSNKMTCSNDVKTVQPDSTKTTATDLVVGVTPAANTNTLDCTFESENFCNWRIGNTMLTYRFEVNSCRNVQKVYTFAPTIDHTTSSYLGNYAYLLSPQSGFTSRVASLVALNPYINDTVCFSFYYYFYASGRSYFQLSMDMVSGSSPFSSSAKQLYSRSLYHSYSASAINWQAVRITVDPNGKNFNIFRFYADVFRGIMAIDDIQVLPGKCTEKQYNSIDCDFEPDSSCLIEPIFNGNGFTNEWTIFQGKEFNKPTGIADHTTHTANGHFYGIDLSKLIIRETAEQQTVFQVETPKFGSNKLGQPICFQFSYYLEKVSSNVSLSYSVITAGNGNVQTKKKLWQMGGSTLGIWIRHHQPLNSYQSHPYSIMMTVDTNGEKSGKMFIDDVLFSLNSHCDNPYLCTFDVSIFIFILFTK